MSSSLNPPVGGYRLLSWPAALTAAPRPRQILLIFLLLHTAALCAVALLTQPILQLDIIEQLAWARDPQWVYFKHPPLPAWVLWCVMHATGGALWAAAIVGPLATTLTLWLVWKLAIRIVDPLRALVAVMSLEGVIYFNFTSLEFNHNVVQMPIWALLGLLGHYAYREGRLLDWFKLGVAAWLGILAKYSTVLMLAVLLAVFFSDREKRGKLLTVGPWLAILTAAILLVPHLVALAHINFAPFSFPLERAAAPATLWAHLVNSLSFLLAQILDILAALLLLAVVLLPRQGEIALVPSRISELDNRFIAVIAFGPICLSLTLEGLSGLRFLDMWGTPMWDFIGLAAVVAASGRPITANGLRRFSVAWCAVFVLAMGSKAAADIGDPYIMGRGGRSVFPAGIMASTISNTWHKQVKGRPLDVAIGSSWYAGLLTVYAPDHPSLMIDGEWWKSPWVTPARIKQSGAVLVWAADQAEPTNMAKAFPQAIRQPSLVIPYQTDAKVPPARIDWALIPPATK